MESTKTLGIDGLPVESCKVNFELLKIDIKNYLNQFYSKTKNYLKQ